MYSEHCTNKDFTMKRSSVCFLLVIILFIGIIPPVGADAVEDRPPYYLDENKSRYEAFAAKNPSMPYDKVIAYVNANVDYGPYNNIETIKNPSSTSAMLNKNFILSSDYVPKDLVTLPGGGLLRAEAAAAFIKMRDAANQDGLTLAVRSSYRTFGDQVASYNLVMDSYGRDSAEASVARAGHSEHQLGLTLDLAPMAGLTGPLTAMHFEDTAQYSWLLEHGHEYGFILRYPSAYVHIHNYVFEPFHWRYVGVKIATNMFNEGITTLEEYYGKYLSPAVRMKLRFTHLSRLTQSLPVFPDISSIPPSQTNALW